MESGCLLKMSWRWNAIADAWSWGCVSGVELGFAERGGRDAGRILRTDGVSRLKVVQRDLQVVVWERLAHASDQADCRACLMAVDRCRFSWCSVATAAMRCWGVEFLDARSLAFALE